MVKFTISREIRASIEQYNVLKSLSEGRDGFVDPNAKYMEHLMILEISEALRASTHDPEEKEQFSLSKLLKNTQLYLEPKPKPKPVPHPFLCVTRPFDAC